MLRDYTAKFGQPNPGSGCALVLRSSCVCVCVVYRIRRFVLRANPVMIASNNYADVN